MWHRLNRCKFDLFIFAAVFLEENYLFMVDIFFHKKKTMRSSNILLLLFSVVVIAKEEIDCDDIEILKMLSEGSARYSTRFF